MRKILLLASVSVLVTGCVGFPFVTVHTLVPENSFVIGDRSVPFKADRDKVEVRPYDGVFRSLYFVVEDRDIEIYDFVVVYDNGERERYDARLVFNHGARSRYFALHKAPRRIRSIEFRYRTAGRWADDQAHVVVYGVR
jgi:hypothetical protein